MKNLNYYEEGGFFVLNGTWVGLWFSNDNNGIKGQWFSTGVPRHTRVL
jgi:hypothetical protein